MARAHAGDMALERIDGRGFPVIRVQFVVPGTTVEKPVASTEVRVMEDGQDVGVVSLALQRDPLAIQMVIDESGSMNQDMDQLKRAATTFVDEMPENTKAGIVAFASEVKKLEDVVPDRYLLRKAIEKLDPYGATALFDGIMEGFHQLDRVEKTTIPTRKVMVVFTDGKDQNDTGTKPQSRATVKEVVVEARRRGIPLYMIGLGSQVNSDLMQKMAVMAGGRYWHAPRSSELTAIYRDLARILGVSYSAAYRTPRDKPDGTKRSVMVECVAKGLAGSAHGAYKAPTKIAETAVAYHATVENARGEAVPQLALYQPYRFTSDVSFEQEINTHVGPLWSDAAILSYQAARLALMESQAALHRSRLLAQKSAIAAEAALLEAERIVTASTTLSVEARARVLASLKVQSEDRRRLIAAYRTTTLAYHNAWAKTVGIAVADSVEAAAAASETASGLSLQAAELTRAGLEVGLAGAEAGLEGARIGLEASRIGVEAGRLGVEAGIAGAEAGIEAAREATAAGLEAGREGLEAGQEALQAAQESLQGASEAVEGAREAVDALNTGMHDLGGASERVNDAQERINEAMEKLGGGGSDWLE